MTMLAIIILWGCIVFIQYRPGVREGAVETVGCGRSEAPPSVVEGRLLLPLVPVAHRQGGTA